MGNDTRYFTHDQNARHDPKIKAMTKKYGMEGYGRYWVIIEHMRETTGFKLIDKPYVKQALADEMCCSVDSLNTFIQDCVEEYELFSQGEGYIYSESLIERMSYLKTAIKKKQDAAYIMHNKYHHNITNEAKEPDI